MRATTSILIAAIAIISNTVTLTSAMPTVHPRLVIKTIIHTVYIENHQDTRTSLNQGKSGTCYSGSVAPTLTSLLKPSPTPADYMAVVSHWRAKMRLKELTYNATLESNAMDTVLRSNGVMKHKLNSGTFGQVLAPDGANDFEHVLVGGWLCEMSNFPGLDGVCESQSKGWAYNGQTGHAEILTADRYSQIGCALHAGIRCCDLA